MEINEYKQQILKDFDSRIDYEQAEFKIKIAQKLISLAKLTSGQTVLDIATGTGLIALKAASLVLPGQVIGVDISSGMLKQAKQKLSASGLPNLELMLADAEHLDFEPNSFDVIFCSLALCYLTDISAALKQWHPLLKPGGFILFNYWSETAFPQSILFRKVAARYGIDIPHPNYLLGTTEKCYQFLQDLEFQNIEVHTEQFGWYYTPDLKSAETNWQINANNVFGFQVLQLSPEKLAQCKAEYMAQFQKIPTNQQGAWCDATIFFVGVRK